MSDPANSDLSKRLRRLPRQLLLALVNGAAILVILAAIFAVIATSKVTHLAENVAGTMTDAVLSRVDENPRQLIQKIGGVSDDVHALTIALKQVKSEGAAGLAPEVADLNERLKSLEANLEALQEVRTHLIDELVAKAGNAVGEALQNFRVCPGLSAVSAPSGE